MVIYKVWEVLQEGRGVFKKDIIMKIYSFPPISNENAKVLILGTMPGRVSLELNQYYGHPRNVFLEIVIYVVQ